MQPYGKEKRHFKIHSHDKCDVCSENSFNKKRARRKSKEAIKKIIEIELESKLAE